MEVFDVRSLNRKLPKKMTYKEKRAEEERLNQRFGGMWHHAYFKTDPKLDELCYSCHRHATIRIEVNIWGVVQEFDVCEEHAEYDGRNCDIMPKRSENEEVVELFHNFKKYLVRKSDIDNEFNKIIILPDKTVLDLTQMYVDYTSKHGHKLECPRLHGSNSDYEVWGKLPVIGVIMAEEAPKQASQDRRL